MNLANKFLVLGVSLYIVAGVMALSKTSYSIVTVLLAIIFLAIGVLHLIQRKDGLNYLLGAEKTDKNISVYTLSIREIQKYKYQQYDNNTNVGVENFNSNSEKIDIISYNDTRYIHKQIEKRNNLWFMRLKIRFISHSRK